jgi:hypothetical protein
MADLPFVEDDAMPFQHHPIRALPWLDTKTAYGVFQFRPTLEHRLAEWCDGTVAVEDGALVVQILGPPPVTARLGDFVLTDGERFWVESPDGFNLRFWPVGRDPGWSHRCFMNWEESP